MIPVSRSILRIRLLPESQMYRSLCESKATSSGRYNPASPHRPFVPAVAGLPDSGEIMEGAFREIHAPDAIRPGLGKVQPPFLTCPVRHDAGSGMPAFTARLPSPVLRALPFPAKVSMYPIAN